MQKWFGGLLIFVPTQVLASAAPSVLPDGAYTTVCTTTRAEKFDKPSGSNSILPSALVSGQLDKMGISRSSRSRTGIAVFHTIDNTTMLTEDYQESIPLKDPNDDSKTITEVNQINSVSTLVIKSLDNGLFEETGTEATKWLFKYGETQDNQVDTVSGKWRRTFEIFNTNLEINATSQTDDAPEAPSHYETQVTSNNGVFVVTYYNRDSYRDDPKAQGEGQPLGGMILQDRTVCTYTPIKQ